jgi:flagellar biosynthesis/type III secretory pathway protein FliH
MFFTEDFDPPEPVVPPPSPVAEPAEPPELVPYFTEQELELARRDGYAAGVADLRAAALEAHEATLAQSLTAIATALADVDAAATRVAEATAEGVTRVLLRILANMMPALCAHYGADEINAVMLRLLPQLRSEPRVTIQVSQGDAEAVHAALAKFSPDLVEQVTLVAIEGIERGDVRLIWQDGTAVRDASTLWNKMTEVLAPLGLYTSENLVDCSQSEVHVA